MSNPIYLPVLVPALGLLVPFIIRWIENKSRLRQARHLLDVIKTRDEIEKLLTDAQKYDLRLLENEAIQLKYYQKELEKEINQTDLLEIRLYPILISLEMIFFASVVFSGAIGILQTLIYAQGNETLPFLEGIFSNSGIRIGLLIVCLLISLYLTTGYQKRLNMVKPVSTRTELQVFLAFNFFFGGILFSLGLVLYLLDLVMPWF